MTIQLDIKPWHSLGPMFFGMSPKEIRSIFQEKEGWEDYQDGNLNDSLLYHGLILGFDMAESSGPADLSRFVEARIIKRKNVWLFGRLLESWRRDEIIKYSHNKKWEIIVQQNRNVQICSLALNIGFDENDVIDFLEMWEPRIIVKTVSPCFIIDIVMNDVDFFGYPVTKEYLNVRDGVRWVYIKQDGKLITESRVKVGRFLSKNRNAILIENDVLVPIEPAFMLE